MSSEALVTVSRKKTRKFLFQRLFSQCFVPTINDDFEASFLLSKFKGVLDDAYMLEMEELVYQKQWSCIALIQKYAPKFEIEKMSPIALLPMYMCLCEMLFLKEEIPAKVSINEAVEVAKVYGDDSIKKVVNGVLNKVYQNYPEIEKNLDSLAYTGNFSVFYR